MHGRTAKTTTRCGPRRGSTSRLRVWTMTNLLEAMHALPPGMLMVRCLFMPGTLCGSRRRRSRVLSGLKEV